MRKYLVIALAAMSIAMESSPVNATVIEVSVFETISGVSTQVASWDQDQNPTPIAFVDNYYTTVPVFNATGLGGDTAVTWYSGIEGQSGGFTNYSEDFNILAASSYTLDESAPIFVPGYYFGADLKSDLTYVLASYTITALPEPLFRKTLFKPDFASPPPAPVPEPASWAMMLVGLGMIGYMARRRHNVRITDTWSI